MQLKLISERVEVSFVFRLCRYCGHELDRARRPLEVCAKCEDSPLCDCCGHSRADHSRVFAKRGSKGCSRIVGDFQSGRSWPCDCEGFLPVGGDLADAAFAASPETPSLHPLPVLRLVSAPNAAER